MNLILTMSLSGSCMCILVWLVKKCLKERLSERQFYNMWKVVLLFYIVPLPVLKRWYEELFLFIKGIEKNSLLIFLRKEDAILFFGDSGISLNTTAKVQFYILAIWIGGILIAGSLLTAHYFDLREEILSYSYLEQSAQEKELTKALLKKHKIHKAVKIIICEDKISPFTFGLKKPVILYSSQAPMQEKEILLEHELVHIKERDVLWKILGMLLLALHWYNPFAWVSYKMLIETCEYACDECVVRDKDKEFCYNYAEFLIKSAAKKSGKYFSVSLSEEAIKIENRMMKILMDRKSINKIAVLALMSMLVLVNSLTVTAYKNPKVVIGFDELQNRMMDGELVYVAPGYSTNYEYKYDLQIVDDVGNIFRFEENIDYNASCKHIYELGLAQKHVLIGKGGCTIYFYNAQRCHKCGDVILKDLSDDTTFMTCTHYSDHIFREKN